MVSEITFVHQKKICIQQKAKKVSYESANGENVSIIIGTDVEVITLRCYYLCVLWEDDCIRDVKRTCYRVPAGKQTACSYTCLNTSLEMH